MKSERKEPPHNRPSGEIRGNRVQSGLKLISVAKYRECVEFVKAEPETLFSLFEIGSVVTGVSRRLPWPVGSESLH